MPAPAVIGDQLSHAQVPEVMKNALSSDAQRIGDLVRHLDRSRQSGASAGERSPVRDRHSFSAARGLRSSFTSNLKGPNDKPPSVRFIAVAIEPL